MNNRLLKMSVWLEKNAILTAIRKGFIVLLPITMLGALAELIKSFPLDIVQDLWLKIPILWQILSAISGVTIGFLSAYLLIAVSFYYTDNFEKDNLLLKIVATIVSFACFLTSSGPDILALEMEIFDTKNIFVALFCAIVSSKIFFHTYHKIEYSQKYTNRNSGIKHLLKPVQALVITISVFLLINLLINEVFQVSSVRELLVDFLMYAFPDPELGMRNTAVYLFLENFMWIFGIHGGNALLPVGMEIFSFEGGPTIDILSSYQFHDLFGVFGGSGSTLCLIIAIFLFGKQKKDKNIAKNSFLFGVFNINEPILFGLPIVLNPFLAIPFILVPLFALSVGAIFIEQEWITIINFGLSWTTPKLISGYLATGSFMGVLAQLIGLVGGILIYAPFVILRERLEIKSDRILIEELIQVYWDDKNVAGKRNLLRRSDSMGTIARKMAVVLQEDISTKKIPVFYQPQVDDQAVVIGAEALLRWSFRGISVPPPLVIRIAIEDGSYDELTSIILEVACKDLAEIRKSAIDEFRLSINISAAQLNDENFVAEVIATTTKYQVRGKLDLELLEEESINNMVNIEQNIMTLDQQGIKLAIDDFSMGKTSLKYLQDNKFAYVKLDGELVTNLPSNDRCKEIVDSIIRLGNKMDFQIVAEYVETEEIREELGRLNCNIYQGYLYGKAVSVQEFIINFRNKKQDLK